MDETEVIHISQIAERWAEQPFRTSKPLHKPPISSPRRKQGSRRP